MTHFSNHLGKLFGKPGLLTGPIVTILAIVWATGCLGLTSHKRQPDTDDEAPHNCDGVSCWEPPPNTCAPDDELLVYAPSGYCSGGACEYASRQDSCHPGLCAEGVCVTTPCQGMTCIDPPKAYCTDSDRTISAPSGYCSGGVCEYASRTTPCEHACASASGACEDSPCAEVFCRKQPAPYCEDKSNLVVFSPEGRCVVAGERSECLYDSQIIPCPDGCAGGRCQDDPCAGVVCDRPPARYCDSAVLVLFEPYGVCDESGFCRHAEQRHPCIEPCVDAKCGEDDACTWVTCNEPPASFCHDLSTLRVYDRDGWCEDGFCSYISSDVECPDDCEEARCKGDPCLGISCENPPPNRCDGESLIAWDASPGTCNDGVCSYEEILTPCASGCANGRCEDDPCAGIECPWPLAPHCQSETVLVDYPSIGSCNGDSGYCEYKTQKTTCAVRCENGECLDVVDESAKEIKKFTIMGINGTISSATISLTIPVGTGLTSLAPTISHTGASISLESGVTTDFTNPVEYTVTAIDNSTKVYTVTVKAAQWYVASIPTEAPKLDWIWDIAVSKDGTKIVVVASDKDDILARGYLFTLTDNGKTWTRHLSAGYRTWARVAVSVDVARIVALAKFGFSYSSADSGKTWTEHRSAGIKSWLSLASSLDGTMLVASVDNESIYTSMDSGANWTRRSSAGTRHWRGLASSSDGTKLAASSGLSSVSTSVNGGETWTAQSSGSHNWWDIASSSDGTKLVAVAFDGNIHTTTDSGVTWNPRATDTTRKWTSVASSSDGTKLAAAVQNGYIYTSTDSGVTWTEHTDGEQREWWIIACSLDGATIAAGARLWKNIYIAN